MHLIIVKVLEMHDLFSHRAKEFETTELAEFFTAAKVNFGLKRADLFLQSNVKMQLV